MTGDCAKCNQSLSQVGEFWICPEQGQVSPRSSQGNEAQTSSSPSHSLCIFLSYGRDANEDLVRRIKADLEKRGHDVWFDKSEIKFGDDWRRSITEGLTHSHKFVSFLAKHSTRDPGVCLDEIGIAIGVEEGNIQTILVEISPANSCWSRGGSADPPMHPSSSDCPHPDPTRSSLRESDRFR